MVPARTAGRLGGRGGRGGGAENTGHGVQVAKADAAAMSVTVIMIDGRSTSIVWRLACAARHASPIPITTTIGAPGVRRRQEVRTTEMMRTPAKAYASSPNTPMYSQIRRYWLWR